MMIAFADQIEHRRILGSDNVSENCTRELIRIERFAILQQFLHDDTTPSFGGYTQDLCFILYIYFTTEKKVKHVFKA
ncbi:unnamed protein product [Clonostachys rosea]|uniref:Uncharacterized protein n=1 Tax=Bionectria ochroleuca TaxID=29856 RepID=A0ABY6TMR5_BIOOC|nr:unnamed protein product [Clonostachys rosea]